MKSCCLLIQMKTSTRGKGIATLVSECHLIDTIAHAHVYINEPETYIRGTDRIYFILCTLTIAAFVIACGIITYDEIAPSDHRGEFLDIQMQNYLANSLIEVTGHTSRKLQTRETAGVVTYKQHLMYFTTTNKIFDRTNNLNDKLSKDKLTSDDMKEINDLDELITKGMLASEEKIKKRQNHYP